MLSTLFPIMSSPDTEEVFEGERKLLLTSKNSAKENNDGSFARGDVFFLTLGQRYSRDK